MYGCTIFSLDAGLAVRGDDQEGYIVHLRRGQDVQKYQQTPRGWAIFTALMAVFLLNNLVCELKIVTLSCKKRHSHSLRARLFVAGVILCYITIVTYARHLL